MALDLNNPNLVQMLNHLAQQVQLAQQGRFSGLQNPLQAAQPTALSQQGVLPVPAPQPLVQAPNVSRRHKPAARQRLQYLIDLAASRASRRATTSAAPPLPISQPQNPTSHDLESRYSGDPIIMAQRQIADSAIDAIQQYQVLLNCTTANRQLHESNAIRQSITANQAKLDAALSVLSQRIATLQSATLPPPSQATLPPVTMDELAG